MVSYKKLYLKRT